MISLSLKAHDHCAVNNCCCCLPQQQQGRQIMYESKKIQKLKHNKKTVKVIWRKKNHIVSNMHAWTFFLLCGRALFYIDYITILQTVSRSARLSYSDPKNYTMICAFSVSIEESSPKRLTGTTFSRILSSRYLIDIQRISDMSMRFIVVAYMPDVNDLLNIRALWIKLMSFMLPLCCCTVSWSYIKVVKIKEKKLYNEFFVSVADCTLHTEVCFACHALFS